MRKASAAVVIAGLVVAGCTDETGLPDLDDVSPDDFPVGATITIDADGCSPRSVTVEAGETVVMEAATDGASAESEDHRYLTGDMREGEETHWLVTEPDAIELECGGAEGREAGTIEVTAPNP